MKKKKRQNPRENPSANTGPNHSTRPPVVTGQCGLVLKILLSPENGGGVLNLDLKYKHRIPESNARIWNLRHDFGFNVQSVTLPEIEYEGRIRKNVTMYMMGVPAWPAPGFLAEGDAA